MRLDEKRKVVEVLLCASDTQAPACWMIAGEYGWFVEADAANDLRIDAMDYAMNYEECACEAAYRLIESSPTLVREWFGR